MSIFVDENETFPIDVWCHEVRDPAGRLRSLEVAAEPAAGWRHVRDFRLQHYGLRHAGGPEQ